MNYNDYNFKNSNDKLNVYTYTNLFNKEYI